MEIQIFVVFHKYIFDDCYKNIPDDILQKNFTFIAVNPSIEKIYTPNKYKVINEWDLPIYDKTFQERGYNENSAIYHVYANELHKNYNYVGFFQYDMEFLDPNIIDFLETHITTSDKTIYFPYELYPFCFSYYISWDQPPNTTLDFIVADYESYYKKGVIINDQNPLYNSYIIPTEKYEKIMKWVTQIYEKMYPWCISPPYPEHHGYIGGIFERVMAFAIMQENMSYISLTASSKVIHDHKYKEASY